MAEAPTHSPRQAWWAVVVLMILQTVALLDRNILALMIIEVRNDLGLNDFEVSLLTGLAFSGFYCIAGLVLGALVDRHAIKRVLYFSVTVWSLAVAATGLAKSFWSVAAARMLTGVAEAGVNPGGQALISSAFPRSKVSLPMSLFAVSGTLGIGLSFFTGGLLLEAFTAHSIPGLESLAPWRQVMVAVGLPGLLFAFLALTLKDTRSLTQITSDPTTWRGFARFLFAEHNLFVRILLAYGLVAVVNYGMSSWAPTYGRRVLKLTPAEVGTEIGVIVVFVGVPAPPSTAGLSTAMWRGASPTLPCGLSPSVRLPRFQCWCSALPPIASNLRPIPRPVPASRR
jgi:MFS family permease